MRLCAQLFPVAWQTLERERNVLEIVRTWLISAVHLTGSGDIKCRGSGIMSMTVYCIYNDIFTVHIIRYLALGYDKVDLEAIT